MNTTSDLINYYHDKLINILGINERDILQITSNSYQRKFQQENYKKIRIERLFKGEEI